MGLDLEIKIKDGKYYLKHRYIGAISNADLVENYPYINLDEHIKTEEFEFDERDVPEEQINKIRESFVVEILKILYNMFDGYSIKIKKQDWNDKNWRTILNVQREH